MTEDTTAPTSPLSSSRPHRAPSQTSLVVLAHIKSRPGRFAGQIADDLGMAPSTVSYHLGRLVNDKLVLETTDGSRKRYFLGGGAFVEPDRRALSALERSETRRVLGSILANPGCYRARLSQQLHVSSATVNWHLGRLLEAELVCEIPLGRVRPLFAAPGIESRLERLASKVGGTSASAFGLRDLIQICGARGGAHAASLAPAPPKGGADTNRAAEGAPLVWHAQWTRQRGWYIVGPPGRRSPYAPSRSP